MIKKEQILATVNQLPDEVPLEDLIEKLIAIQKIDQGLDDIREGRTYSNEEAKEKTGKWLK